MDHVHCGEPRKNQTAGQWEKEQERKARNIDRYFLNFCFLHHALFQVCDMIMMVT